MNKTLKKKVKAGDTLTVNKSKQKYIGRGLVKKTVKVLEVISNHEFGQDGEEHMPLFRVEGEDNPLTHRFFGKVVNETNK